MKLLLVSDTQTDRSNLEEHEILLKELLRAAKKYQVSAIIHCGDVKEVQNELISLSVVKFWIRATKLIRERGYRFIVLRGNHDRVSQSANSKDWLDILRTAGAETISSKPAIKLVDDGKVAFLPFTSDRKQEREWAEQLAQAIQFEQGLRTPTALIFHSGIQGAKMNAAGMPGSGITLEELRADSYTICLGGHFHSFQKIGDNCHYVGSPFTHSWSEVNEHKGILFADIKSELRPKEHYAFVGYSLKRTITSIPPWYDASFLEHRIKDCANCDGVGCAVCLPEINAYIRSYVPVTTKKVTDQIKEEEERLRSLFGPNVRLFVIPKIDKIEEQEIKLSGTTDEQKVEQYVAHTFPENARFLPKVAVRFLSSVLQTTGPSPLNQSIRLRGATGKRVLSFEEVEISYENQGLVLIEGYNKDWGKRSNGSGKSSLLSLLTIALFGKTPKGQVHDEWAQESSTQLAKCTLAFRDNKKRDIVVERTRRPHGLAIHINGIDKSSGLSGKSKNETQGDIESLIGYDYPSLLNSIYIDDAIANSFLFGTQKDRMSLIGKLVNLERYEAALKTVSSELNLVQEQHFKQTVELEKHESERESLEHSLEELKEQIGSNWLQKKQQYEKDEQIAQKKLAAITASEFTYHEWQSELDNLQAEESQLQSQLLSAKANLNSLTMEFKKVCKLIEKGNCPECGQSTQQVGFESKKNQLTSELAEAEGLVEKFKISCQTAAQQRSGYEKQIKIYEQQKNQATQELKNARVMLANIESAVKQEEEKNKKIEQKKQAVQHQLKMVQRKLKAMHAHLENLCIEIELLDYAKKAFNRSGMPLLLCQQLVPVLNHAAQTYAEMFFEGRQQVRFNVEGGEFQVSVINPNGSGSTTGQSVGERAMAGIITALSLRECAPKTNLLILDEPANGLDPEGAKLFASGLIELSSSFETVLVTTHNQTMSTLLEGKATVWRVVKEGGISRLIQ